jgi:hypothetical protein
MSDVSSYGFRLALPPSIGDCHYAERLLQLLFLLSLLLVAQIQHGTP